MGAIEDYSFLLIVINIQALAQLNQRNLRYHISQAEKPDPWTLQKDVSHWIFCKTHKEPSCQKIKLLKSLKHL